MHVDGSFIDVDVTAPDTVQQLLPREDAPGPLHQELEQLELGRPEMQLLATAAHAVLPAVEMQVMGRENVADMSWAGSPEQGAHPRDQFGHGERLDDVVIGAGAEAPQPVRLLAFC